MVDRADERRDFARSEVQLPVRYGWENPDFSGIVDCISFGGVRIRSAQTFAKETVLQLQIIPSQDLPSIEGRAAVVWVHNKEAMGLKFMGLDRPELLKLERIITPMSTGSGASDAWD